MAAWVKSRMKVRVCPFCRKGLSPQGEACLQVAAEYWPGLFVDVHAGRGKPRSPARRAGPAEIRNCTRRVKLRRAR